MGTAKTADDGPTGLAASRRRALGRSPGIGIRGPGTRLRSGKPELRRAGRERATPPRHLEPAQVEDSTGRAGRLWNLKLGTAVARQMTKDK